MKRLLLIVTILVASCGGPEPNEQPETQPEQPQQQSDAATLDEQEETAGQGVELFFYAVRENESGERSPSFKIESKNFEQREDETWTFTDAHAVIHTEQGANIEIDAGEAIMNYNTKTALMESGVNLERGDMAMTLDQLEWSNDERTLMSSKPVTIEHGETLLKGATMRYYPDENRAILTNTQGVTPLFDEDESESQ